MFQEKKLPENLKEFVNQDLVNKFWLSLYKGFFVTVDAIDNGIDNYPKDVKPKFNYYKTDLASRVGRLNPQWWDQEGDYDAKFKVGMEICKEEFLHNLLVEMMGGVASIPIVRQSFESGLFGDGQIIVLDTPCYWKEAITLLEQEKDCRGQLKFVLFPDKNNNEWRAQAIPVEAGSFESRKLLHPDWRGKTAAQIAEASGFEDAVFVHHSGFIGGCKSKENTLKMAEQSLLV